MLSLRALWLVAATAAVTSIAASRSAPNDAGVSAPVDPPDAAPPPQQGARPQPRPPEREPPQLPPARAKPPPAAAAPRRPPSRRPRPGSGRGLQKRLAVTPAIDKPDCPPSMRYPVDIHDGPAGALNIFRSPQGRRPRLPLARTASWCSPWSDRGCGYSHAYTKQPPAGKNWPYSHIRHAPHRAGELPHGRGGVPAAFDDWRTLLVGGDPGHPSAACVAAFVNHTGSFARAKHPLMGGTPAVVRHAADLGGCARTIPAALLLPLYVQPWPERNYGHFLGDVWHWLFQLLHLYGERFPGLPVVWFPANDTARLSTFPTAVGYPQLVPDVAGDLRASGKLGPGRTCVGQLIADCPAPNVLTPYDAFQRHLARRYGWSFTPRPANHSAHPSMLLLLRRPGGSRVLRNPQEVAAVAHAEGMCVSAVRPDRMRLSELISALQGADVLAAVHGAEIAAMTFLRNASVVVEAVPDIYADGDGFFVAQQAAGGLSLVRWRIPISTLHYWGNEERCNQAGRRGTGACVCLIPWRKGIKLWDFFRHRGTRGYVQLPSGGWREVVRAARDLLPWDSPGGPCTAGPVPNVSQSTGIRDIADGAELTRHLHGLRCGEHLIYPFQPR
eukprot:TRINITY_DN1338_c1_g1_i5.p1 TRINITY_DN1338_c1_g1~~TRINITY_DN1338_c1_g1_i5.p1  ORF type:complete len:613 (+),score=151.13 TRINITY_DN1338_c1_g1_i5:61-1899(+)